MWNPFKHHKDIGHPASIEKPNIEQLNDYCIECPKCGSIQSLPDFAPLSISKCLNCKVSFFVPYRIKIYWLYRPLGGGGMGSVYKAASANSPEKEFAVKILPREKRDDQFLIDSLINEAKIGSQFGSHPHLTFIDDYGNYEGEYFCAMDFVAGQRLDELININAPDDITDKLVLLWALQVLSAEQRMYDAGFLYRDLKPQNIIIDGKGNVHLIDYGLCVHLDNIAEVNQSSTVEGSPLYMPPERIVGAPEDMGSEIYSLGMVMFHALAKKTYYSSKEALDLAKKHVKSLRFSRVDTKMPITVSPRICHIIDKMIARQPKDRFHTYIDAAQAIKEVYNHL